MTPAHIHTLYSEPAAADVCGGGGGGGGGLTVVAR